MRLQRIFVQQEGGRGGGGRGRGDYDGTYDMEFSVAVTLFLLCIV